MSQTNWKRRKILAETRAMATVGSQVFSKRRKPSPRKLEPHEVVALLKARSRAEPHASVSRSQMEERA